VEANVIVSTLPVIERQPAHQSTVIGGDYSFRVYASGTSPLEHNGSLTTFLSLEPQTRTDRNNVQPSHAGNYSVVVRAGGSTTSRVARATIFSRVHRGWRRERVYSRSRSSALRSIVLGMWLWATTPGRRLIPLGSSYGQIAQVVLVIAPGDELIAAVIPGVQITKFDHPD
jgi:hypothetical protein